MSGGLAMCAPSVCRGWSPRPYWALRDRGWGGVWLDGLQDGDWLVAAADGDLAPAVGGSLSADGLYVASCCYPAVSLGACHEIREFHEYTVGVTGALHSWVIPYRGLAEDPVPLFLRPDDGGNELVGFGHGRAAQRLREDGQGPVAWW